MDKKLKEGVRIQDIENFIKKKRIKVFFALWFLIVLLLSFFFLGSATPMVLLAWVGGVIGFYQQKKFIKHVEIVCKFICKQENITKFTLYAISIAISFFIPILTFFTLGLIGGSWINAMISKIRDECFFDSPKEELEEESRVKIDGEGVNKGVEIVK